MRYPDPRTLGARCDECPRKGRTVVPPQVNTAAKRVWLGESPGRNEARLGVPFVGATGQLMQRLWDEACAEVGVPPIARKHVHVTNATLCEPLNNKNEREHKLATDCCRPRLVRELMQLPADAGILCLGKWAFYALFGHTEKVADYRGFTMMYQPKEQARVEDGEG